MVTRLLLFLLFLGFPMILVAYELPSSFCEEDCIPVEFSLKIGRKLIQVAKLDNATKKIGIFPYPKMIFMASPGIILVYCSLLCSCFRARKKDTSEIVLTKDVSSAHSTNSNDGHAAREKIRTMPPKPNRLEPVHLTMSQIVKATHNFSPSLKIGEGFSGTVYKAQLLNGQVVAIKRAKKEFFEALEANFISEVELLAKIEHLNLVKLLGYVDQGNERIIITEYMPNGTLREHLDGQHEKILDFNQRLEISIDVAHALAYLHFYAERQIIHRDVTSSNILLTERFKAKVSDFGFARVSPVDSDNTHISTKVKGTIGYLDPEYMKTYKLTSKSDVYSFGVLLIEILTGRCPVEFNRVIEERITLQWAFKKYNEGNLMEMVDPLMHEIVDMRILEKLFGLAIQCSLPKRNKRPDMKLVGKRLWEIRMDYFALKRG